MNKIFLLILLYFVTSCSSTGSIEVQLANIKHDSHIQSTSKAQLDEASEKIKRLRIGEDVASSEIKWEFHEISAGGKVYGLSAKSGGWLSFLSGGLRGALFKLGKPVGIDAGKVIGNHVFGYSWSELHVIPRYIVITEAEIIPTDSLAGKEKYSNWFYHPSSKEKVYFKDVYIKRVVELDEPDMHRIDASKAKEVSLKEITEKSIVKDYMTESSYKKIQENINALEIGMPMFQVVSKLNGMVVKAHQSEEYFIYGIHGFLNNMEGIYLLRETNAGLFLIWPYGYLSESETVIKSVLIFKNGEYLVNLNYESNDQVNSFIESHLTNE